MVLYPNDVILHNVDELKNIFCIPVLKCVINFQDHNLSCISSNPKLCIIHKVHYTEIADLMLQPKTKSQFVGFKFF